MHDNRPQNVPEDGCYVVYYWDMGNHFESAHLDLRDAINMAGQSKVAFARWGEEGLEAIRAASERSSPAAEALADTVERLDLDSIGREDIGLLLVAALNDAGWDLKPMPKSDAERAKKYRKNKLLKQQADQ